MISPDVQQEILSEIQATYDETLKLFPDLAGKTAEDVRRLFNILLRFAPSIAATPLVSGSWISAMFGGDRNSGKHVSPADIKQLCETELRIREAVGAASGSGSWRLLNHPDPDEAARYPEIENLRRIAAGAVQRWLIEYNSRGKP